MDPLGAITPFRNSGLIMDADLASVIQERGLALNRKGHHIARRAAQGTANKREWTNVKHWASGCWSLEPLQHDMANLHESEAAAGLIITDWQWIVTQGPSSAQDMMTQFDNWAQSTVTGASYGVDVPAFGDPFYRKVVPAAGSFDPSALVANAGFDSDRPALPYPNADIPMDRVGVGSIAGDVFLADAGFFLRWRSPGTRLSPHRYLWAFHFGQYALVLTGSGEAQLWEYAQPAGEDAEPYYVQRDTWRYTQEAQAAGTAHCMAIFPQVSSDGGRYISFSNLATASAPKTNTSIKTDVGHSVNGEHVYRITRAVMGTDVDQSPGHATYDDYIRIDIRRDLKLDVQISRLGYKVDTNGSLLDDAILAPNGNFVGNTNTVHQNYGFVTPSGTVCTGEILDAVTGVTYVPGVDLYPQAKFTLTTSSATVTPTLWSYHHIQDPVHIIYAPGAFVIDGREYNLQGYAGDPQTEMATVEFYDVSMTHTRLQKRGRFSAIIATGFAPDITDPGGVQLVKLFHGVALSPQWEQVGGDLLHPGGAGPGAETLPTGVYVAPDFCKYFISIVGMYNRLAESVQGPYPELFSNDPTAPQTGDGYDQSWKITDIIKYELFNAGFDASFQNIPDLPYRIWGGYTDPVSDLTIEAAASRAEWLVRIIREHLGAFLHFEPNAGVAGQWILIFGTQHSEDGTFSAPLYNFTRSAADIGSALANPHGQGAFAAVDGVPTTFIRKVRGTQNPPDFNSIEISCALPTTDSDTLQVVKQVIHNFLSYKVPGSTVDPDPDHPDFIGHHKPYEMIAPQAAIGGDGASDIAATQKIVDWLARRYYDFLCHGQKIKWIEAPLVFVQDTSLSATAASSSGNWRPLRFQDPIMYEGDPTWLIKSVQINFTSDRAQMATYEIIQPFPGQHFIGHNELELIRKTHKAQIAKHSGMHHGATHAGKTLPAHKHSQHHRLSMAGPISTIQNPDGTFIPMTGWNTWDGSDG